MKSTSGVSGELSDLAHGWVLPDAELVLGETVSGQQFSVGLGPGELTHLGSSVGGTDAGSSGGVPETNVSIG